MTRTRLAFSVAMVLALTACGGETRQSTEATGRETSLTGPDAPQGISVADGRMNLPAASGNPAALYFTLSNNSPQDVILVAADVSMADSTMLHETVDAGGRMTMNHLAEVPVPAGGSVTFEQGGKHVMVFDLADGLAPGDELEATLTFKNGDKISFPVHLLAPGDIGAAD